MCVMYNYVYSYKVVVCIKVHLIKMFDCATYMVMFVSVIFSGIRVGIRFPQDMRLYCIHNISCISYRWLIVNVCYICQVEGHQAQPISPEESSESVHGQTLMHSIGAPE